jgi:hypothetical protein
VVEVDGSDDGHVPVDDVGGVPGAAHADLDDRHVHGRVREGGVRHAGQHLEEGEPVLLLGVDHLDVRPDVVVRLDEPLGGDRGAVEADALGDRLDVRGGVPARTQLEGTEECLDHAGGGGLAVGTGDVDGGVRPLRLAQEVHQRGDPPDRGLQLGLTPAGRQLRLDGAQRLVEGRVGGPRRYVGLRRAALGTQGATAGLDHREVGVAVGLGRDDLVEGVDRVGLLTAVVRRLTHGVSLRTGRPLARGYPLQGDRGSCAAGATRVGAAAPRERRAARAAPGRPKAPGA